LSLGFYNHSSPCPRGGLHRRCAPGSPAPAPLGGPSSTFSRWWWVLSDLQLRHLPGDRRRRFHVGGGHYQTFSSGTSQGPAVDVFILPVGALGPSALAPPGGPPSTFSRWWWALPDLQLWHLSGARRRHFHVGGGRSRTFSYGTSREPVVDIFTLVVGAPRPSAPAPPRGPPSGAPGPSALAYPGGSSSTFSC
jgi:hypothetical protein